MNHSKWFHFLQRSEPFQASKSIFFQISYKQVQDHIRSNLMLTACSLGLGESLSIFQKPISSHLPKFLQKVVHKGFCKPLADDPKGHWDFQQRVTDSQVVVNRTRNFCDEPNRTFQISKFGRTELTELFGQNFAELFGEPNRTKEPN